MHLLMLAGGERAAAVRICAGFRSLHAAAGPDLPAGLPQVSPVPCSLRASCEGYMHGQCLLCCSFYTRDSELSE